MMQPNIAIQARIMAADSLAMKTLHLWMVLMF